jgi:hypothetical protein
MVCFHDLMVQRQLMGFVGYPIEEPQRNSLSFLGKEAIKLSFTARIQHHIASQKALEQQ